MASPCANTNLFQKGRGCSLAEMFCVKCKEKKTVPDDQTTMEKTAKGRNMLHNLSDLRHQNDEVHKVTHHFSSLERVDQFPILFEQEDNPRPFQTGYLSATVRG